MESAVPRRRSFAAALVVAGLTISVLPAAAAGASTGSIVIDGISSPSTEDGLLSLQAEATSPITSFTVDISSSTATVLSLPSTDFTLTSGSATDGIWTVTSPITQAQLALGTYQVTVDAQDSGGDSVTDVSAGSYGYVLYPAVTLSASTTELSYTQQSTTMSGQVTATYPDGSVQPLSGQVVDLNSEGAQSWTATTNSQGDFSAVVTPNMELTSSLPLQAAIYALVPATSAMAEGFSPYVSLTGVVYPVQITTALSTSYAQFGQPVTFSGTVQYQAGGVWLPLTDATVDVNGTDVYSNNSVPGTVTTTTDGSGDFLVPLPAQPSTTWTATLPQNQYLASPGYSLYDPQPNSATLTVQLPSQLTGMRASYDPYGDVEVSSCLGLTAAAASFPDVTLPDEINLAVQYSAHSSGPWRTISSENDSSLSRTCTDAEALTRLAYSGKLSGYYRFSYGGDYMYERAASAPAYAATAATRFSSFNISPRSVSGHGRITVSGVLQQDSKGWHGLGRAEVLILVQPPGYKTFAGYYKKVRTSASGRFSISFADPVSAHWAAYYEGNSTHLASLSKTIYVSGASAAAALRVSRLSAALTDLIR
jgi:hypothetical protein